MHEYKTFRIKVVKITVQIDRQNINVSNTQFKTPDIDIDIEGYFYIIQAETRNLL